MRIQELFEEVYRGFGIELRKAIQSAKNSEVRCVLSNGKQVKVLMHDPNSLFYAYTKYDEMIVFRRDCIGTVDKSVRIEKFA